MEDNWEGFFVDGGFGRMGEGHGGNGGQSYVMTVEPTTIVRR